MQILRFLMEIILNYLIIQKKFQIISGILMSQVTGNRTIKKNILVRGRIFYCSEKIQVWPGVLIIFLDLELLFQDLKILFIKINYQYLMKILLLRQDVLLHMLPSVKHLRKERKENTAAKQIYSLTEQAICWRR